MREEPKIAKGTLLGAGLAALVLAGAFGLGFLLGPIGLSASQASSLLQAATGTNQGTTSSHQDQQFYANLLEQNLAARLGTDKGKVNSAFAAAAGDTINQAVQNGDLSQDQATKLRDAAGVGLGNFITVVSGGSFQAEPVNKLPDPKTNELVNAAINAAAAKLGVASADDVMTAIKQGSQSLSDLAQAHNTTAQALQDEMLHAAKAHADSNVASGKWTQAEADEAYNNLSTMIDKMLTASRVERVDGLVGDLVPAAFHAGGVFLGLSNPDDMGLLLKRDNKSLTQIAQEHNASLDGLKNAMLQAARAQANSEVADNKITQADADAAYNSFNDLVQTLTTGTLMPSASPTPAGK